MAPIPGRTPIERSPLVVGLDPMVIHFNFRVKAPKEGVPYRQGRRRTALYTAHLTNCPKKIGGPSQTSSALTWMI